MEHVFPIILEQLQQGHQVALATVVSRKGSLPMSTRAKMAVLTDGSIAGTIGGGKLEAEVIQTAVQGMAAGVASLLSFELTADQVESDGLTCGGTVDIFLEYFFPETSLSIVEATTTAYDRKQSAVMATLLPPEKKIETALIAAGQRLLIHSDGTSHGTTENVVLDDRIRQFALPYIGKDSLGVHSLNAEHEKTIRIFLETIVPRPTAYLFGGGHLSYQLARLLSMLDFDFVVIDDRETFANQLRFPEANACVVHEFSNVFDTLTIDAKFAYVIIVTRGHQSDFQVLQQALQIAPKYIGMIGSRRKIQILFDQFRQQGVAPEILETVHAPIGLEIGADTPEEIAVSIAAELIKERRHA